MQTQKETPKKIVYLQKSYSNCPRAITWISSLLIITIGFVYIVAISFTILSLRISTLLVFVFQLYFTSKFHKHNFTIITNFLKHRSVQIWIQHVRMFVPEFFTYDITVERNIHSVMGWAPKWVGYQASDEECSFLVQLTFIVVVQVTVLEHNFVFLRGHCST